MLHYNASLNKTLLCSVKLIEYIFSAVSVCYNPCLGPLLKIKITFFLFSIFVDELISAPKIITLLSNPVPGNELPCLSNPIPYPEYLYFSAYLSLSISVFLVKLTEPIIF